MLLEIAKSYLKKMNGIQGVTARHKWELCYWQARRDMALLKELTL